MNIVYKFQVHISNGMGFKVFEDLEEKDHWLNQSVN